MIDHRRSLVLAATALDWPLAAAERAALEEHLASCGSCSRTARALGHDAARIQMLPQHDAPARVRSIVLDAAADRPRVTHHSPWLLLAAAMLLVGALIGGTLTVGALVRYFDRLAVAPLPTASPVVAPSATSAPSASAVPATSVELVGSDERKLQLDIVDHSGNLVDARSPTSAELNADPQIAEGEQFVLSNAGTPNVLKFKWRGGGVAFGMSLTIDQDVRVLRFVSWPAPQGDAIAIERGVVLTFSRSIPAESVQVELIDAGPAGTQMTWNAEAGLSWKRGPVQPAFADAEVRSVVAGGPGLVAVGTVDGTAAVWTSRDGLAWSRVAHTAAFDFAEMADVTVSPEGLVAVGYVPGSRPAAWTSTDGLRWERAPESAAFSAGGAMRHVAAGGLGVVAGGGGTIWSSTDGRAWERVFQAGPIASEIADLIVGGPGFVAVGCDLDQGGAQCVRARAWTSADGRTWVEANPIGGPSLARLTRVVATYSGLVALGLPAAAENPETSTSIWMSTDGKTWRLAAAESAFRGFASLIVAAGSGAVAVGGSAIGEGPINVWTSRDGLRWTKLGGAAIGAGTVGVLTAGEEGNSIVLIGRSEVPGSGVPVTVWISPREGP
jgi:hypothetical protein